MAVHDLQRMNQSLKATISWLMMTGDYYSRLNSGEFKCVLVEGKTDQRLLERSAFEDTRIHVVSDIFRSRDIFRQDYAARCTNSAPLLHNAKGAVTDILAALKMADFLHGPKGAESWKVYGVIDSDYDLDETASVFSPNLFKTDTHDIETLLLMTDPALVLRMLDGFFCEEDVKKAFTLAYQLAKLRIAIYRSAENLLVSMPGKEDVQLRVFIRNRLRSMQDDDLSLFVKDNAIDVTAALAYVCGCLPGAPDDASLPAKKMRALTRAVLEDKAIKRSLNKEKTGWKANWKTFKPDADFYCITHGHDIARFLRYVTKERHTELREEQQNDIVHNMEFMMVDHYSLSCFGRSDLGKKLIKTGVWVEVPA